MIGEERSSEVREEENGMKFEYELTSEWREEKDREREESNTSDLI